MISDRFKSRFKSQQRQQQLLTGPPFSGLHQKKKKKKIAQATRSKGPSGITMITGSEWQKIFVFVFFSFHFLKPLKFVFGLTKWKYGNFY